MNLRNNWWT